MKDILVSVVCTAYNHEAYIASAIDSFLMQKTNFNYEILIHDDASTDKTAEIILKYESKYPDIIKTIYQKENQHSKGVKILNEVLLPIAKGKYIAICEGDDFWNDESKLQKQFQIIEEKQNIKLVTHAANRITEKGESIDLPVKPFCTDKILSTEDILLHAGSMFPTNSYFFRRSDYILMPSFYMLSPVGDRRIVIYLSTLGNVYYSPEIMSSYRVNSKGSWSSRIYENNDMKINFYTESIKFFRELNLQTNYNYDKIISIKIENLTFYLDLTQKGYTYARKRSIDYYKSISLKEKIMLKLKYQYTTLYKVLRVLKNLRIKSIIKQ